MDFGAKFAQTLDYIEGIGPAYAEKLAAIGLVSLKDLLERGSSSKGRDEIAEQSGISRTYILEWVNHVDLMRLKGVGSEYADLLEAAGVDTVVELAQRNPANLFEKMLATNAEKKLVRRTPVQTQVEDWVAQAKSLPRLITY
jgi:predicted flap endonuclease-1-like 5' DNA nuclease